MTTRINIKNLLTNRKKSNNLIFIPIFVLVLDDFKQMRHLLTIQDLKSVSNQKETVFIY